MKLQLAPVFLSDLLHLIDLVALNVEEDRIGLIVLVIDFTPLQDADLTKVKRVDEESAHANHHYK